MAARAGCSEVTLDVLGILEPGTLPAAPPAGRQLLGAAAFEPDGQTFGAPLPTVRLPVRSTYHDQVVDGEVFRLYRFDGFAWIDSGVDSLIGANLQYPGGKAAAASVDVLRLYAAFITDLDGAGLRDSQDADRDGDGVPNESDCAPDDPVNPPAPGEVSPLSASKGAANATDLSWNAVSGAATYDVARGTLAALRADGNFSGAPGLSCAQVGTDYTDAEVPSAAGGFYYLTRAANACGKGTWGSDGDAVPRSVPVCP